MPREIITRRQKDVSRLMREKRHLQWCRLGAMKKEGAALLRSVKSGEKSF
jgi:hypothetical protein